MAAAMDQLVPGLPDEIARECLFRVPYTGFHVAKSVCTLWRDEIQSPVFHRFRMAAGLSRTVVVMVQSEPTVPTRVGSSSGSDEQNSGSNGKMCSPGYRLTLYEPETGTWSTLPAIPGLCHGLPLFCQVAAVGHTLVVVGGWDPSSWAASEKVFVFDFVSANWRRGKNMPGPRRSFFACASDLEGMVFVAGGHDEEKNALKSAMAYVVEEDRWVPLPDMAEKRDECKGVFLGGEFVVFGGYSTELQGQFGKSAERFQVGRWGWGELEGEALGVGVCPRTCVAGSKGRVFRCENGKVEVKEGGGGWRVAGSKGRVFRCENGKGEVKEGGGGWREVTDVPEELRVAPWVAVVGEEELLVVGSACHGGEHQGWLLNVGSRKWSKVAVPDDYSGHVQAGCCLYI